MDNDWQNPHQQRASPVTDTLELNGVAIVDTFAEAFPMAAARLVITATSAHWARVAAVQATGFATSVIACDCEAGIERELSADETPDGRPGISVLLFGFSRDALASAAAQRVGQCILTCPTTACYNGITDGEPDRRISIGGAIRYFGDGFQISKRFDKRRFWRLPTMDGEFVCEDRFGTARAVGGGNLLLCGADESSALAAAEAAVTAMTQLPDVILPFPGGIVRSGSKVGSQYKKLKASTNDPYCPTVRPLTTPEIPVDVQCVYEIVVDGLSFDAVQQALKAGLQAASAVPGLLRVTAGNYGGKLGKHHFHLRDLL